MLDAGGLDMAVMGVFGGRVAWHSEVDEAASKVLAYHYPTVPNLGDITTVDWAEVEPVDVLCGGFPCFTAGVPVLTDRGFVPIEKVQTGDLVLTHQNRWRKVTATMHRTTDRVVEFAPGMFSTPEHRIYTRTARRVWDNENRRYRRTLSDERSWVEAEALQGLFTARPSAVPACGEDGKLPAGLTWWQVGRWVADGWTSGPRGSVLCVAIGEAKRADLKNFPGWSVAEQRTVNRAYRTDKAAADWLHDNFGYGAHGKTIPAWALWMPEQDRRDLLAGYWSGDAYLQAASIRSTSVSPTLIVGVRALAESCGYSTSLSFVKTPDQTVIEGRTVNQRDWWRLDARVDYGRYTERDGEFVWAKSRRSIRSVDGPVVVYDLTVDEDHSFVAAGMVVHNCQDVSSAGKRAGIREGTRSGLWAVFADAIEVVRPRFVVIENVKGLLSATAHRAVESEDSVVGDGSDGPVLRAIGAVLGDLSDLGFDAWWTTVSAASVGAPHRRDRVFILATATDAEIAERRGTQQQHLGTSAVATAEPRECFGASSFGGGTPANSSCNGWHEGWPESAGLVGGSDAAVGGDGHVDLLPTPNAADGNGGGRYSSAGHQSTLPGEVRLLPTPRKSDGDGGANPLSREERMDDVETRIVRMAGDWGKYAPAIHRWEQIVGPAPSPTEPNRNGKPPLNPAFSEWMMGWPAGWVTDPAIGIGRSDQLRAIGNGVVPQQAVAALRWLLSISTYEVAA